MSKSEPEENNNHPRRRPARSKIAVIKLDDATRKQILEDLGVDADITHVPEEIHVTRVSHTQVGLPRKLVRPNSWVLVMV